MAFPRPQIAPLPPAGEAMGADRQPRFPKVAKESRSAAKGQRKFAELLERQVSRRWSVRLRVFRPWACRRRDGGSSAGGWILRRCLSTRRPGRAPGGEGVGVLLRRSCPQTAGGRGSRVGPWGGAAAAAGHLGKLQAPFRLRHAMPDQQSNTCVNC